MDLGPMKEGGAAGLEFQGNNGAARHGGGKRGDCRRGERREECDLKDRRRATLINTNCAHVCPHLRPRKSLRFNGAHYLHDMSALGRQTRRIQSTFVISVRQPDSLKRGLRRRRRRRTAAATRARPLAWSRGTRRRFHPCPLKANPSRGFGARTASSRSS